MVGPARIELAISSVCSSRARIPGLVSECDCTETHLNTCVIAPRPRAREILSTPERR